MKKSLLLSMLFLLWISLSWCDYFHIADKGWMEYDRDPSKLVLTQTWRESLCEDKIRDEVTKMSSNLSFEEILNEWENEDAIYQYLVDFLTADNQHETYSCTISKQWNKIELQYIDSEYFWWGEWYTLVENDCNNWWWEIQHWQEWWEDQDVCVYSDNSYCYLTQLADWTCEAWEMIDSDEWDPYPVAEQYCIDNNGQTSEDNEWIPICIFENGNSCEYSDITNWECKWINYGEWTAVYNWEDTSYCTLEYNPVCWEDGQTYSNPCWLWVAWVEEATDAEIIDGVCVFG